MAEVNEVVEFREIDEIGLSRLELGPQLAVLSFGQCGHECVTDLLMAAALRAWT